MNQIINIGSQKEPSKQAIDRFIEIYMEIVSKMDFKPNQEKELSISSQ